MADNAGKLRRFCRDLGYTVEKCKRAGWWMVGTGKRIHAQQFADFNRGIKLIGYEYFQDCTDKDGSYWMQIRTKK